MMHPSELEEGEERVAARRVADADVIRALTDRISALSTNEDPAEVEAPAEDPALKAQRRGTTLLLQKVLAEQRRKNGDPPDYCIYCGSEGDRGTKCMPCGFYRGTFCFPPGGLLQRGNMLMGRTLTYVSWPWTGDPDAPYVPAQNSTP